MASISVGEADFDTLLNAARDAEAAGHAEQAYRLDVLARKVNAALSYQQVEQLTPQSSQKVRRQRWQDVPSTLVGGGEAGAADHNGEGG